MENKTFVEQIQLLKDIDILLTPHGAALTSSIFLPPCSSFLEIFPNGYYWDQFYGSLASISNHGRATLYEGEDDGDNVFKSSGKVLDRKELRKRNICINNVTLVIDAITKMESMWYQCCKDRITTTKRTRTNANGTQQVSNIY